LMKINKSNSDSVNWYLNNFKAFESGLNGGATAAVHQTRKNAIEKFAELGFPTRKNESWRYTDVTPILKKEFTLASDAHALSAHDVQSHKFARTIQNTMVFINGVFSQPLSTLTLRQEGVRISNLAIAFKENAELVERYLGKYAVFADEPFTALNTGFLNDGIFIHVAANVAVAEPIHVIHIGAPASEKINACPRALVALEKGAEATLIESFHGVDDAVYFNNVVGEYIIHENAHFKYLKIQEESRSAYHVSNYKFHQERDSVVSAVNVDFGGALVRNNLNVLLNGPNCETHLFGLFVGGGSQHIDNQTFVDHAMPNCFSNELYKGILNNHAQGVFNGKILVRQDAQKTNALQSNKTLLLADDASVNAKPQLEIFADDVKCTHGATIGQLDDEALFYLRARGIGEEMAKAMLRHAFVADILEKVSIDEVREHLDAKVMACFKK